MGRVWIGARVRDGNVLSATYERVGTVLDVRDRMTTRWGLVTQARVDFGDATCWRNVPELTVVGVCRGCGEEGPILRRSGLCALCSGELARLALARG